MNIKKSALTLSLSGAVAFGLILGVKASDTLETISAYLNYGITVKYNGEAQELKDADGNKVYPITYEGTTYLPVRAISNILGIEVNWDGPTKTVWLGEGFEPTPPETPAANSTNSTDTSISYSKGYTKDGVPIPDSEYYYSDQRLEEQKQIIQTGVLPEGWSISDPI